MMQVQHQVLKRIIALLCITILLSYASVVFLPHSHECIDLNCTVCDAIEISRNLLIEIGLLVTVCLLTLLKFIILTNKHTYFIPIRDGTPVALKVRLLD